MSEKLFVLGQCPLSAHLLQLILGTSMRDSHVNTSLCFLHFSVHLSRLPPVRTPNVGERLSGLHACLLQNSLRPLRVNCFPHCQSIIAFDMAARIPPITVNLEIPVLAELLQSNNDLRREIPVLRIELSSRMSAVEARMPSQQVDPAPVADLADDDSSVQQDFNAQTSSHAHQDGHVLDDHEDDFQKHGPAPEHDFAHDSSPSADEGITMPYQASPPPAHGRKRKRTANPVATQQRPEEPGSSRSESPFDSNIDVHESSDRLDMIPAVRPQSKAPASPQKFRPQRTETVMDDIDETLTQVSPEITMSQYGRLRRQAQRPPGFVDTPKPALHTAPSLRLTLVTKHNSCDQPMCETPFLSEGDSYIAYSNWSSSTAYCTFLQSYFCHRSCDQSTISPSYLIQTDFSTSHNMNLPISRAEVYNLLHQQKTDANRKMGILYHHSKIHNNRLNRNDHNIGAMDTSIQGLTRQLHDLGTEQQRQADVQQRQEERQQSYHQDVNQSLRQILAAVERNRQPTLPDEQAPNPASHEQGPVEPQAEEEESVVSVRSPTPELRRGPRIILKNSKIPPTQVSNDGEFELLVHKMPGSQSLTYLQKRPPSIASSQGPAVDTSTVLPRSPALPRFPAHREAASRLAGSVLSPWAHLTRKEPGSPILGPATTVAPPPDQVPGSQAARRYSITRKTISKS
ncbi:hypothetical protein M436DRAFT_64585 [Aureobasidium namibiae CBS 147.97]|uniref:Uncharacterized protein n=1 Tax=Aureobasidium namibiae CBS 147.97 TaxID=1043004 RepID=A0A074WHL8_9PEZI|nr:uncharacterized protein M436DRAFT_64585 [Aureobasidium namibiae CBS 147.97]KEQ72590.1 hypothetical protein M436DRAFT_64585 [Aureobasidium namibiae CBS 147.97]